MTNDTQLLQLEKRLKHLEGELSKLQQEALKLRGEFRALNSKDSDSILFTDGTDIKLNQVITKSLTQLGIPTNTIGFFYLKDVILLVVYDNTNLKNISILYKEIAKQYNSTRERINRGILYAIESAWKKSCLKEKANNLLKCSLSDKPTNREFIRLLADYIKTCFFY